MIFYYPLQSGDMEPDDPDMVTEDAIKKYIAVAMDDPYWKPQDAFNLVIDNNGTWTSPGTFGSTYGHWYVDGSTLEIMIDEDD